MFIDSRELAQAASITPLDRRNILSAVFGAVFCVASPSNLSSLLFAQQKGGGNKGKGKGKDKDNEVQIDGTVRQVSPQGIYVEGDDRTRYLVGMAEGSQVTLLGDVDASFLTPGTFVEFDVELDRAGNPTQEVKSLTFVDASSWNPAGLFQTSAPTSEGGKEGLVAYLVRGRVSTARTGQLVVQTGERIVSVKTSAELSLTCRLDGWNFASVGDSIRGNVEFMPQPNTGITHVVGRKLTIRAAKPLKPSTGKPSAIKAGTAKSTPAPNGAAKQ